MLLVRALLLAGALERLGQQRVRERLARDPLCVERVGLAALTGAIRPRRAIRAHIAHVMAAAGQEHRRVPAPARRALDPPPGDLPKLPRPRLQLAVPLTRDAKVSRTQDPAARIGDRRGQRALVRIDPDHVARMIGRHQQVRRSRTTLLGSPHRPDLQRVWCWRTGRQHPGGRPHGANAPIRSGRSSKARTEADTSSARHPRRSQSHSESDLGSAFDPTRTVARAGNQIQHRDRFTSGRGARRAIAMATSGWRRPSSA